MKQLVRLGLVLATLGSGYGEGMAADSSPMKGPLRRHPANPRYFTDDSGRAILLTGSHTWNNLVDMGPTDPPPRFDHDTYLKWLSAYPHNFFRLWTWELVSWDTRGNREVKPRMHQAAPQPWKRTGPGNALDGKPKFNLKEFDEAYFARLRQRMKAAQDQGIYAAVMLFEGWGVQFSPGAWRHHPFHPDNNVNGINGDLDGDGMGLEIHTGRSREVTELQRAYVRKVVDTVNEFDHTLYEISNENHPPSTPWQYDMIRLIHDYERAKPKQHPVGMTFQYKGGSNATLFASPADWISPNTEGGYRDNPPPADGSKVILNDTDHLWGIGGNVAWVWKSLLRGLNPIFMDPYKRSVLDGGPEAKWEPVRQAMGQALRFSRRVDLATLTPRGDLVSSKFCLANPGADYLAFLPAGGSNLTVILPAGSFRSSWLHAVTGQETPEERFSHAGGTKAFTPPIQGEALLYVQSAP